MTGSPAEISAAEVEVRASRAKFFATLNELHERVRPQTLVRERVDLMRTRAGEIADETFEAARAQPGMAGAIGAGAALLLFRRPIVRLVRRLFFKRHETGADLTG